MKKVLSAIVSVGVLSSLFSSVSLATSEKKDQSCFFESSAKVLNNPSAGAKDEVPSYFLYKNNKTEKIAKKQEKQALKEEKKKPGVIKKIISAIFYGFTAKKVVDALDRVGYINSAKFSERAGNILGVLKKGPNPKKIVLAAAKNQRAVKDVINLTCDIPTFSGIFSLIGKVGGFFGIPDFSKPVGALVGAFVALTNEKTVFETVVENAADYIDDEGENEETPENKK